MSGEAIPSDIDGRVDAETPGGLLARLLMNAPDAGMSRDDGSNIFCLDGAYLDLDAIAASFKAAVLAGRI